MIFMLFSSFQFALLFSFRCLRIKVSFDTESALSTNSKRERALYEEDCVPRHIFCWILCQIIREFIMKAGNQRGCERTKSEGLWLRNFPFPLRRNNFPFQPPRPACRGGVRRRGKRTGSHHQLMFQFVDDKWIRAFISESELHSQRASKQATSEHSTSNRFVMHKLLPANWFCGGIAGNDETRMRGLSGDEFTCGVTRLTPLTVTFGPLWASSAWSPSNVEL